MSEHIRPEWLQIPRDDVEAELSINGMRRVFSTADTAVWLYPDRYKMFNHLIKQLPDGSYEQWFGVEQEEIDTLHEAGVTMIYPPYPNDNVIAQFWAVEMRDFEDEMTFMERTGELPKTE